MRRENEDWADDIAIVGVGCRFPGGITDPEGFWSLLTSGGSTVTSVPADRWDDRFHHADQRNPGTSYSPRGSFLDDVDRFDAGFFGISPREAHEVDPQQRLLLESSWAAMEDSGIPRDRWEGTRTGVYLGVLAMDYTLLHAKTSGVGAINPYYASGKEFSFGAGRISYTFGLHGPTLMLSTACSSSLMAVHLAVRALRSGECDAALAGGVNLMLTPELGIYMSKVWALSPSGVCRPFDAAADGVVRSEGCGVVVLKRYADAVADGDRVWAVVHGSAANHDGRSAGITAPNAVAQQDLLRTALADAGREPMDLSYVEAHGTGTPLGDPIELSSLAAVLGSERPAGRPLYVGSHKANFGHMDSAAGIAGLLKSALIARHGVVPPQINLDRPTAQFDWSTSGLTVATDLTELASRPDGTPALAGVSAFGLSGTNAHVIVGPPPVSSTSAGAASPARPIRRTGIVQRHHLLTVSGHTESALRSQAAAYRERVAATPEEGLPALIHTAGARRTHHERRVALTGRTGAELVRGLDAFLENRADPQVAHGDVSDAPARPVVQVFGDQGTPWPGAGLDLYDAEPLFADALDECHELFARHVEWSLLAELGRGAESRLTDTAVAQPATFAIQVGLSRLWSSWGMAPDVVVGHGTGEVAAAVVAGSLTLADGAELIVRRGEVLRGANGSGRTVAVDASVDEVTAALEPFRDEVTVAAVNGPTSVVIAGPHGPVEKAVAALLEHGARCVPLTDGYALHTPLMRPYATELRDQLTHLTVYEPEITVVSTVRPDGAASPHQDADYWAAHLHQPVRFWPAIDRLLSEGEMTLIEVGVDPVLHRPLLTAMEHHGRNGPVVSSLHRDQPATHSLGQALAQLQVSGAPIDWHAVTGTHPYEPLPPLPLAGDAYWLPRVARGDQGGPASAETPSSGPSPGSAAPAAVPAATSTEAAAPAAPAATAPATSPAATEPAALTASAPDPQSAPHADPDPSLTAPTGSAHGAREEVAAEVSRLCAEALGHDTTRRVPRVRGFFELGMDSFSLGDFVRALEGRFEVTLGDGAGIHYPTIDQLTDHLLTLIDGGPPTDRTVPPATAPEPQSTPKTPPLLGDEAAGPALTPADQGAVGAAAHAVASAGDLPGWPPAGDRASPAGVPDNPPALALLPVSSTASSTPPQADPPRAADEPIAIVGMACRLPGADGVEEFWQVLVEGVDASSDIPTDRFDADALLADGPVTPGTIVTKRGSFLDRVDGFDNAFFRISAREARSMDPQQRLFLQVAWEALDDAGVRTAELPGSRVGLYVGLNTTDYMQMVTEHHQNIDLYYGTGNSFCGTAGRLSYFLGVRGPSMAVDTACSSSLTAVHLACQGLRTGEASLAIAGGSNVMSNPTVYLAMSAAGALSPDGRCKTFSAAADGYGRGEGAGAVVLKTLSQARADGDRVYAVLRGSAVNHNGASGGLTVPSAGAQREVLTDSLQRAGIAPADVDYVEAHGTGTRLGDGIELTALAEALSPGRAADRPLLVGSVKTNIGHLEAAAGIAGLIKTTLALHHGTIPPHLHFDEPSTQVEWSRLPVRVTDRAHPWPADSRRTRVAGVSAFGFTGTNAHVLLAEVEPPPAPLPSPPRRAHILPLSAANDDALRESAARMEVRIAGADDATIGDICYTAGARRTHLEHRLVAVGRTTAELRAALTRHASQRPASGDHTGRAHLSEERTALLVYGAHLADLPWRHWDSTEPECSAVLDAVDAAATAVLGTSARRTLYGTPASPADRRHPSLALLAGQLVYTALLRAYGVRVGQVAGRGGGEIAAACTAGLLSLTDAVRASAGERSVRLTGHAACGIELNSLHGAADSQPLDAWQPPIERTADEAAHAAPAWLPTLVQRVANGAPTVALGAGEESAARDLVDAAATDTLSLATVVAAAGRDAVAHLVAELHVRGCPIGWVETAGGTRRIVSLPAYPWQQRSHWITGRAQTTPPPAPAEPTEAPPRNSLPQPPAASALPPAEETVPPAFTSEESDGELITAAELRAVLAADEEPPPQPSPNSALPQRGELPVNTPPRAAAPEAAPAPAPTADRTENAVQPSAAPDAPELVHELHALGPELRVDRLLEATLTATATALGESSGSDVDPDLGFFDLGLDSVMAVALMDELGPLLGVELEPTLTFEHPTCRALAGHLLETVLGAARPTGAVATPAPTPAAPNQTPPTLAPSAPPAPPEPPPAAPAAAEPEPVDDEFSGLDDDALATRLLERIRSSEALLNEVGLP
uniref:Type I polyketide synthase n=1 Tax=Streptomyces sp. CNQ-418 TaxID=467194 RepID=J7GXV9_9ACTN|nr:type I polyketide synthase [Streptomyces sp. CNQ-418]